MRIAHLSDIHLCTKYKRENIAKTKRLIKHALNNGAQHFVITGDISDNANEDDFQILREILKRHNLFSSDKTTITIGNHDIFGGPQTANDLLRFPNKCFRTDYHEKIYKFIENFRELFEGTIRRTEEVFFPFLKVLDKVVLIGLNTIDTYSKLKNPFASNGHVSNNQRDIFSQLLFNPAYKNKAKVVLSHHHFYEKNISSSSSENSLWDKVERFTMKLRGKKKLIRLFNDNDVKLVLHGHSHEMFEYNREGITFLNAGASVDNGHKNDCALYLIDVFPNLIQTELIAIKNNGKSYQVNPEILEEAIIQ
jgi:3',5'-cyclic AMP phosphodiesterase CpdA